MLDEGESVHQRAEYAEEQPYSQPRDEAPLVKRDDDLDDDVQAEDPLDRRPAQHQKTPHQPEQKPHSQNLPTTCAPTPSVPTYGRIESSGSEGRPRNTYHRSAVPTPAA